MAQPLPVPDDRTILETDHLYRRVKDADGISVVLDRDGNRVASSAAFQDDEDGISAFLESTLAAQNLDIATVLDGFDGYVLARLSVRDLRSLGLGIVRDPYPPDVRAMDCNVAHCLVKLPSLPVRQKHKLHQNIARASSLI